MDHCFEDGVKIKTPSEISLPFKVSHADEEDIETEDEESRGSDTTEEKRIGSTLCSLIGVSNHKGGFICTSLLSSILVSLLFTIIFMSKPLTIGPPFFIQYFVYNWCVLPIYALLFLDNEDYRPT